MEWYAAIDFLQGSVALRHMPEWWASREINAQWLGMVGVLIPFLGAWWTAKMTEEVCDDANTDDFSA